jgi:hypothetical protein
VRPYRQREEQSRPFARRQIGTVWTSTWLRVDSLGNLVRAPIATGPLKRYTPVPTETSSFRARGPPSQHTRAAKASRSPASELCYVDAESIRSSDGGASRPFATDLLDAGRAAPVPSPIICRSSIYGDNLSVAFLWLGGTTWPSPPAGLIPRIPTMLKSFFALLW